ncbi:hypothetical protein EI555_016357, partial [Monodon monoceros]
IARMAENGDNEKMAALEAKICHQIEYYFGDFNLPCDKFLKEQIKLDEGWVPLEIMIKFNRLNCLTTDFNSKGRRFKGKGKGNKAAQTGSAKGKVQFQGKKTKFDSDDEHDENGASRPVERAREETDEEPASKQQKMVLET